MGFWEMFFSVWAKVDLGFFGLMAGLVTVIFCIFAGIFLLGAAIWAVYGASDGPRRK